MRTFERSLTILLALFLTAVATVASAAAQMPTSQPAFLTIYVEDVKLGRNAEHVANERGWPAAFRSAGSTDYYLALEAMTGSNEVWFTVPFDSYAAEGESLKMQEDDPALQAELARLWRTDGELLNSARTLQAVARPDLSHGAFPDLSRARFWDIATFRIRPGHDAAFMNAVQTYAAIAERVSPEITFRTYMVTAGRPGGTYLMFTSVNDYAEFDQAFANGMAAGESMSDDEREIFEEFSRTGLISMVNNRFRLNPDMSYVADETVAVDPAFWNRPR